MYKSITLAISEIKKSYFYSEKDSIEVIHFLKSLKNETIYAALKKISMKATSTPELPKKNLYHLAWRVIEKDHEYPFKINEEVRFANKVRKIKSINTNSHMAEMENGDLIHLFLLSTLRRNDVTRKIEHEQLSLF